MNAPASKPNIERDRLAAAEPNLDHGAGRVGVPVPVFSDVELFQSDALVTELILHRYDTGAHEAHETQDGDQS